MYSTVNKIFHFSYFDPDYPTSGVNVIGLARVYFTAELAEHTEVSLLNRDVPLEEEYSTRLHSVRARHNAGRTAQLGTRFDTVSVCRPTYTNKWRVPRSVYRITINRSAVSPCTGNGKGQ
jgi:hypothetical protein